ncbi:DUF6005 family protein [Paenibacillus sp. UMB4589-SE434]|uniref:DUF6005 family protein n=1 Tax=Paenibacillus sp. UMB4589-SE434 TaxID=3046314 RepID=UPI00254EE505|nr:DUF6005 family protein [Paenibacillus sp. UMB4589-SE434]MDK8180589.1 DUF6005 family protein [Paenibacillus sp. UMB4589-SE434]
MIKVHCIVSCLCEIVKRRSMIDYRPFYFGVWDANFEQTDRGEITYYSDGDDYSSYMTWYEKLFGTKVVQWYDQTKTKQDNVARLLELVANKQEHQHIILQLDMSLLPERENKFNQSPFPHYLMVEQAETEDEWFVLDPDFRWEGIMKKERILQAVEHNPLGGGFVVDASQLRAPSAKEVEEIFEAHCHSSYNELTSVLRHLILTMAEEKNGFTLSMLTPAVKQMKVIAIRKYSYEYAFMYFKDRLYYSEERFEYWTDRVEDIVKGLNKIQYLAIKMSMSGHTKLLPSVLQTCDLIDQMELAIKRELVMQYELWKEMTIDAERRLLPFGDSTGGFDLNVNTDVRPTVQT